MSSPSTPADPAVRRPVRRTPGETGIWVFILGDMLVFALCFGVFIHERSGQVALFDESRRTLNVTFGAINTLLLLSGSLFVVRAMHSIRAQAPAIGRRWIAAAFACGIGFGVNKVLEYGHKLDIGHGPHANDFFMYFFVLTGIHFLHLIIGLTVLAFMWRWSKKPVLTNRDMRALENGAAYWHMVDLLWIVLFALLYLMS